MPITPLNFSELALGLLAAGGRKPVFGRQSLTVDLRFRGRNPAMPGRRA